MICETALGVAESMVGANDSCMNVTYNAITAMGYDVWVEIEALLGIAFAVEQLFLTFNAADTQFMTVVIIEK